MTPDELIQLMRTKKLDAVRRALFIFKKMRPKDYEALCLFYKHVE